MSNQSRIVQGSPRPRTPLVPGFGAPSPTTTTQTRSSATTSTTPSLTSNTQQSTKSYYTAPPHPSSSYTYPPPPPPTPQLMSRPPPPRQVGYGFLTPPPAPVIGSLAVGPTPVLSYQSVSDKITDLTPPGQGPAVVVAGSGGEALVLGVRRDLYDQGGSGGGSSSDHSVSYLRIDETPGQDLGQIEVWEEDTLDPPTAHKEEDDEIVELKPVVKQEEPKVLEVGGSFRCDFCPSPGLVAWDEKIVHQAQHSASCFSCAACNGRRNFAEFDEMVRHVHSLHMVTDSEMVLETIILPQAEGGLRMFRCGVKNCGKTFTAQSERVLRTHMELRHGSYYLKVGKGKYILRFCRICGDERKFGSEKELDSHIELSHPPDHFGQQLSEDEEDVDTSVVSIKQEPGEHMTDDLLLDNLGARARQAELPGHELTDPSHEPVPGPSGVSTAVVTSGGVEKADKVSSVVTESETTEAPVENVVEEGEIQSPVARSRSPSEEERRISTKKKRKRTSNSSSQESSSSSSREHLSDSEKELKKSAKKNKHKTKHKKAKLKRKEEKLQEIVAHHEKKIRNKVEDMTSDQVVAYLKEMKDKKKSLKLKEKRERKMRKRSQEEKPRKSREELSKSPDELVTLPEPKIPFPSELNGKPTHFYCLVCSTYTGKLDKWKKHRRLSDHVAAVLATKEAALKTHNCADMDMQECVMGESKFQEAPVGQCRECLKIFWTRLEHSLHLKDGRCVKTLERQRDASPPNTPSRSPSPNIIWKPLRSAEGGDQRSVFDKSPSPESGAKRGEVEKVAFPKFMLDGKTAYFICKLCKEPVGNLLSWLDHKKGVAHMTAYRGASLTEKMDEVIIANSPSVLHKFGDINNKCIVCGLNFPTNAQLFCHEQSEAHRQRFKAKEEGDRELLRIKGEGLPNLFYCDLCLVSTCSLPSTHLTTQGHLARLEETVPCYYCPKRLDPAVLILHVDAFHPDSSFQCKTCPTKFNCGGEKMLEHASQHLRRRVTSVDEVVDLAVFSLPCDLRRIRCKYCKEGVFLAQESSEAVNHVLTTHPEVNIMRDMSLALEFSCQLCLLVVQDEKMLTDHIYMRHTSRLSANLLPAIQRFSGSSKQAGLPSPLPVRAGLPSPLPALKRKFMESPSPIKSAIHGINRKSRESPSPLKEMLGALSPLKEMLSVRMKPKSGGRSRSPPPKSRSPVKKSRSPIKQNVKLPAPQQSSSFGKLGPVRKSKSPDRRSKSPFRRITRSPDQQERSQPVHMPNSSFGKFGPGTKQKSPVRKLKSPFRRISPVQRPQSPMKQTRNPVRRSSSRFSSPRRYRAGSSPRRYSRSRSPGRRYSRTKSPGERYSRSRSPGRRYTRSKSPGMRYSRSRSPRRRYSRSRSPPRKWRSSRSPPGRYRTRSRSRSSTRRRPRTRSPPENTWSGTGRAFSPRRSRSRSFTRNVRRLKTISLSRSRSRSPGGKRRMKDVQGEISKQLDRRQEEAKLLSKLKKNLKCKKTVMENDLRSKLESKKVRMLDSRTEGVKTESIAGGSERVCPFCVTRLEDDDKLLHHMKMEHQTQMFGCTKCYSSLQPCIAWTVEVMLQHLGAQHKLNVSISEAISSYVEIPANLHRVNCKLCPPPHILGAEGFWVGGDLLKKMESIEKHFEAVHGITEKPQIVTQLELACRGCDATFPHAGRLEWLQHVKKNHERLNRPRTKQSGPKKRCDYCGEDVVQTETIRHIKEAHAKETFQCKVCLEADPTCFPHFDTIKEMTGHMVMKHGDQFSSYYDHMIYPLSLYGSLCSNKECETKGGKVLAFDAATIGKHLRIHQSEGSEASGEFYCRCCDRVKERFKTIVEVNDHIAKRHKQIIKWKQTNGNFH